MDNAWDKNGVMAMADSRVINYSGRTLCENYRRPLARCGSAAQAIRLFKNCVGWALQERYPTKDELLCFTSKEVLAENGVYVDMEFDGERIDSHVCCVFLNCKGRISTGLNVAKAVIPMLYLSEGSDLEISVDDFIVNPVPVELYYGSRASGSDKLAIKDCNGFNAADNVGFTEEELMVDPDMDDELL